MFQKEEKMELQIMDVFNLHGGGLTIDYHKIPDMSRF